MRCGACDRDRAGTMISLYGQPYDPTTLKTVPPSEEAVMNRVRMKQDAFSCTSMASCHYSCRTSRCAPSAADWVSSITNCSIISTRCFKWRRRWWRRGGGALPTRTRPKSSTSFLPMKCGLNRYVLCRFESTSCPLRSGPLILT